MQSIKYALILFFIHSNYTWNWRILLYSTHVDMADTESAEDTESTAEALVHCVGRGARALRATQRRGAYVCTREARVLECALRLHIHASDDT